MQPKEHIVLMGWTWVSPAEETNHLSATPEAGKSICKHYVSVFGFDLRLWSLKLKVKEITAGSLDKMNSVHQFLML